nr:reverse transcriptase domain-containing protein [Tanacetum cinerariifolium]
MHEGCSPVRQKKRGQAPERNKAIQEEVEKLVDTGIMKGVHYHSWLSNQVMVKKHDDSWRMCLDFKDVNKACLKDDYSLPEIDWKNSKATYQRLVDKAFQKQISRNLEKLIARLPTLTTPMEKEELIVYLAAAREAYMPRKSIKGQILAYFIVERQEEDSLVTTTEVEEEPPKLWILFTNGSSCVNGFGAGLILMSPKGTKFTYALRFRSPEVKNASTSFAHLTKQVLVEELSQKSINEAKVLAVVEEEGDTWMTPIHNYLTNEALLAEKEKARVGIDIAGPFLKGPGKVKFLIVAIDYFTKWIEAKPVATIKGNQIKKFVWDNIVCIFGLPGEIISDTEKEFRDNLFKDWCEKLCVRQCFASVKHPQANGLVERANRSMGEGIKA